jgi:Uma2 family endonuclease
MMKAMGTTTLMSFAEFERLDGGADHLELLKGELLRVPPAIRSHMEICRRLFRLLDQFVESQRGNCETRMGTVYFEMGYRMAGEPASWLQPDVSLSHASQSGEPYFDGAPLIAFEVVSSNDRAQDMDTKVSEFLANGAREVWLIYPITRHARVFTPADAVRTEHSIRTSLLPGLDIPLETIL